MTIITILVAFFLTPVNIPDSYLSIPINTDQTGNCRDADDDGCQPADPGDATGPG